PSVVPIAEASLPSCSRRTARAAPRFSGRGRPRGRRSNGTELMATDPVQTHGGHVNDPQPSPTFRIGGELPVHRLGFGAMRITGEGIWGEPPDPEAAKHLLRLVLDLGIDLIDTADSYGPNVSERLIGEALAPYPKHLVIATKGGLVRPGPGEWNRCGRPDHLRNALEGSLRRLKLDSILLYQLHAPDPEVPFEDQ